MAFQNPLPPAACSSIISFPQPPRFCFTESRDQLDEIVPSLCQHYTRQWLLAKPGRISHSTDGRSYSSIKFKPGQEEIKSEHEWRENKAFFRGSCLEMTSNNSNAAMILKDWKSI